MCVPSYIIVDYVELDKKLKELIKNLINLEKNEDNELYFYGGNNIECEHNKQIINNYLPMMKKIIKGYSNWSNLKKTDKIVANHLKLFCRISTGKPIVKKCVRFPQFKSKMVNRFTLPVAIK